MGLGENNFIMGEVERLYKYFEGGDSVSEDDLKRRLEVVERDIRESWGSYKRYQWNMHGQKVEDNGLRMVLLWLLRRGII